MLLFSKKKMIEELHKHAYSEEEINELSNYKWVLKNDLKGVERVSKKYGNVNSVNVPLEWCIDTNKNELDEPQEEINEMYDKMGGIK
jgi:predicted nucleotidyltransferase